METVHRKFDRAANGAAGVVDQNIHPPMIRQSLLADAVALLQVGQVARINAGFAATFFYFAGNGFQFFCIARHQ